MIRLLAPKVRIACFWLLAVFLAGAQAVPAQAASPCAPGWSDMGGGVCEMILRYNGTATTIGTVQYVTVPANVTAMTMVVAGGSGQGSLDTGDGTPAAGGKGGRQTGTIPVVPGDTLNVYVGQTGDTVPQTPTHGWYLADPVNPGAYTITGAFGGGGLSSSNYGGFGGGGSFVFDSQPIPGDPTGAIGNLLIAAGGGGGAGYDENQFVSHGAYGPQKSNGGHGSGATAAADGIAVGLLTGYGGSGYSPGPGRGAAIDAPGAGGVPQIPGSYAFGQVAGGPGTGPAVLPNAANPAYTWLYLGAGGNAQKGTCCYYYGEAGGGGGGNYGGGAGGSIEAEYEGGGGGGGSGYVAPTATNTLAETGVQIGDGEVTLRYVVTASAPPTVSALSPTLGPVGTSVTLTGTNFSTATRVAFNGTAASFTVVSSSQITAIVPAGATTGPVTVTNASGSATSATSFSVTVVPTTLSALQVSAGALAPAFASGTVSYSASVAYAVGSTTVTATATSTGASLSLSVNGSAFGSLVSGTPSAAQSLRVGANTLVVRVTAPDGTYRDYTVTITRAAPSTVKTLSALKFSSGTLSPKFSSATLSYSIKIATRVTSYTVTATATSGSGATLAYQVGAAGAWLPMTSGVATAPIAAVTGTTPVRVRVTAQDGSYQDYVTNVTH